MQCQRKIVELLIEFHIVFDMMIIPTYSKYAVRLRRRMLESVEVLGWRLLRRAYLWVCDADVEVQGVIPINTPSALNRCGMLG